MEFRIEKIDFLNLLGKTQNIVEKRSTMPTLVNVLLEAKRDKLRVYATDLEVSLTDEAPIKIKKEGRIAVHSRNLFQIIREMDDNQPILFKKKDNNWLTIQQEKTDFTLVGTSPDEFPVFPVYKGNHFMSIPTEVLKDMIGKTIYSVSHDETRYHLNGVYFEKLGKTKNASYRMVATDGHRLSLVDRNAEDTKTKDVFDLGVIIPRKGLNEVKRLLEDVHTDRVSISVDGSQFIFKNESTVLMVRLIEGKYPNYKQLIPKGLSFKIKVARYPLVSSLKRVSLLSNQSSKGVTLDFSKKSLKISSNNPDMGEAHEELDIDYKGDQIKIGFNAKYLLDILNSFDDEDVQIHLNDRLSPGLIKPCHDKDYTCIVMPMRI